MPPFPPAYDVLPTDHLFQKKDMQNLRSRREQEGELEVILDMREESLMSRNSEYSSGIANKMSPYTFSIPTATGWATCIQTASHSSLKNKVANTRLLMASSSWPALSLNHAWTLAAAGWHRSKPAVLVQLE